MRLEGRRTGAFFSMSAKKYVISWAQNNTRPHSEFLAALKHFPAELKIVRGFYRNPTSKSEAKKLLSEVRWHPSLEGQLVDEDQLLTGKLKLYASIRVPPTASRPLSGFEVLLGAASGIVGHPRRQLKCVATDDKWPRLLMTTGACTVSHYSESKAGAKARRHHTIGALVVEITETGTYFCRQITWSEATKSFTDQDKTYSPSGVKKAPPAAALVVGDVHWGSHESAAIKATFDQITALRPESVVLHDFFDCRARNHHDSKSAKSRHLNAKRTVEAEVNSAVGGLVLFDSVARVANPASETVVVRSNHDEALDRWAFQEHSPEKDPLNTPYWHRICHLAYDHHRVSGSFPDLFPLVATSELLARGANKVRFLKRDESFMRKGIQLGFHGHAGINGAKGAPEAYAKLGVKTITGHTHSPAILDGATAVGHIAQDDLGYNNYPSTWARANCVVYADGKRSLLFIVGESWRS